MKTGTPFYIGIDIGTTSTKGIALTRDGQTLALERASYPTLNPQPGFQEQEPEALFLAVLEVLDKLARQLERPPEAIGLSCAMHSLIAADEAGKPLTNALLWSDRRSERQAQKLRGTAEGKALYRSCGTPIHAMSPLCKLRWLQEEQPEVFRLSARFLSIKDYLLLRLCGECRADISLASASGLMDILNLRWHPPALAYAGIREEQLPALAGPEFILRLNHDKAPPLFRGAPLAVGASDGCLANLGALALSPDELVLTIGTSGALRASRPAPVIDEDKQIFNYRLDEQLFICGGAINNGGIAYQWLSELLGAERLSEAAAMALPPGADGLLFHPYLLGERAPIWAASASGAFTGLRRHHGPAHFHRAVLEGVAFSLYHIFEGMSPSGVREIIANGGFTHSPLWVQIVADVFGRPIRIDEQEEATACGAAFVAMKADGVIKDYRELLGLKSSGRIFEPNPACRERYQEGFKRYVELIGSW
ncbi:MAG: gluconokinase [Phaeodactylibacter sp.]|nr:gluconokinase [Phaeodactylibacter sp.]MCB9053116.1 gluconokinase [Lewinellaceae bacterium]